MAVEHYNDLKHTTMLLFNAFVDCIRRGSFNGFSIVDYVLSVSHVIEETTLMREQMKVDESNYKHDLIHWYVEGCGGRDSGYRTPSKVATFKAFRAKKSNKAKDFAFHFVTKMYRLDQVNRREIREEDEGEDTMESINKLYDDDVIGRDEYYDRMRAMFQKRIAANI